MPSPARERDLIRSALDAIEAGSSPDLSQATALLSARADDLARLMAVASRMRDEGIAAAGNPGVISYSRKVFLPITTLCRDRCHYCIFVDTPGKLALKGKSAYLSPEAILEVASDGARLGCKEALFTLGDRPEERWPLAREWLDAHGYASTLDYVLAMGRMVLEETGLLPHLNPGVMTWAELQRLRSVAPSMGMMLETTSRALWAEKGGAHFGSPDKDPAIRLRVLEDSGRSRIPFSTGVLLGLGETMHDRAEAFLAIRDSHERWGHVQEVIVQNLRTKPATAMQNEPDLNTIEYVAAVAVARVVMGPEAHIQAPPNLTDSAELHLLIGAGIDDWGGVSPLTPDHVNPERPWPQIDDLAMLTAQAGYRLEERLTAHPRYIKQSEEWIDERLVPRVRALALPSGMADPEASVRPHVYAPPNPAFIRDPLLHRAESDPAGLTDADYQTLLRADGDALDALASIADGVRAEVASDLTFVVNRNIDGGLFGGALDAAAIRTASADAWESGASEICVQGAPGQDLPGESYFDIAEAVKAGAEGLHLHAFRPAEIADGATRLGISAREFLRELSGHGVDTVPGTGARILDDRIRSALSAGTDMPVAEWLTLIETAHREGLRSTATMVYGHLETPRDVVGHLRALLRLQDATGGFTEFIPMPFVPADSPVGLPAGARPGPSTRETRAVHAVARLMLSGRIDHVQAAWTKLGLDGARRVLAGGADDLGGLLLGASFPAIGAEAGRTLDVADVRKLADELGRPARQRTTGYGSVAAARLSALDDAPARRIILPEALLR